MLIEITYFFRWILSSIIFVFWAYTVKLNSMSKNEAALASDDNVWNDKDSDDFLRYLKHEFFLVAHVLSFILMEFTVGFGSSIFYEGVGLRPFWPVQSLICVFMSVRAF